MAADKNGHRYLRSDTAERDSAIGRAVVDNLVHGDAAQAAAVQQRRESRVSDAKLQADAGELREVGPGLTVSVGATVAATTTTARLCGLVTVNNVLERHYAGIR